MAPLIQIAALLWAKQQQQKEARRQAIIDLQKEKARRLGGDTIVADAADFNRKQANTNFIDPQTLMQIFATGDKKDMSRSAAMDQALDADLAPNKSAYSLSSPGDTQLKWSPIMDDNAPDQWTRNLSLREYDPNAPDKWTNNLSLSDEDPYALRLHL